MKKLLFLGIDTSTADALAYAKSKGIHTIITDHLDKNQKQHTQKHRTHTVLSQ